MSRPFVFQGRVLERSTVCFGASQAITLEIHRIDDVIPEGGVTTLGRILVVGYEYILGTASTGVHSNIFLPVQITRERSLMSQSLCNIVLQGSELVL